MFRLDYGDLWKSRGKQSSLDDDARERGDSASLSLSLSLLRARIYIRRERDGCKESVSQEVARKGW